MAESTNTCSRATGSIPFSLFSLKAQGFSIENLTFLASLPFLTLAACHLLGQFRLYSRALLFPKQDGYESDYPKTIGARIAQELNIRPEQVAAAVALLDEGATFLYCPLP